MSDLPPGALFELGNRVPLVTVSIPIGNREWRITAVQNQEALLDSADDFEHFPFGLLLWEAAVGLARHIAARPEVVADRTVLELGAGVGVAGVFARSLGAAVHQTDHQKDALRLAELNAAQNGVSGIETFLADWRSWEQSGTYDIVIGADITYERSTHFYLEQIFTRNLAPSGAILLSDPGRPQTLEFAAYLEGKGWRIAMHIEPVSLTRDGKADPPVDVAILTLRR